VAFLEKTRPPPASSQTRPRAGWKTTPSSPSPCPAILPAAQIAAQVPFRPSPPACSRCPKKKIHDHLHLFSRAPPARPCGAHGLASPLRTAHPSSGGTASPPNTRTPVLNRHLGRHQHQLRHRLSGSSTRTSRTVGRPALANLVRPAPTQPPSPRPQPEQYSDQDEIDAFVSRYFKASALGPKPGVSDKLLSCVVTHEQCSKPKFLI